MSEVFVPHTKLRNLSEPKPKLNILSQPNINLNLMFCQNPTPTEAKIKMSINPYKYGPKILVEITGGGGLGGGGGQNARCVVSRIARLTDHPPKWDNTFWKK